VPARLYPNENFPRRVVEALRSLGHDVLTSLEAKRANQRIPDEEVLRFATQQDRAVLTHNRCDFIALHRKTAGKHAGIIVCTQDLDPVALARRIDAAIRASNDLSSQLVRVVKQPPN
jgi:predicted nuclease of predicted toxin-antitoxin system